MPALNRRRFLGAAAALSAVPLIAKSAETGLAIKPVTGDICPTDIRESFQYDVNNDAQHLRYDMAWIENGKLEQFYADFMNPRNAEDILQYRKLAKQVLNDRKPFGAEIVRLPIRRGDYKPGWWPE